jgi:hypothetical protein
VVKKLKKGLDIQAPFCYDINMMKNGVIVMNVAKTILSQIKALDAWSLGAWGAKDLVALEDGLQFKSSGMVKNKGIVQIKLNYGKDLYDVSFGKIRKYEYKEIEKVTDVFVEDLVNVIDEMVG